MLQNTAPDFLEDETGDPPDQDKLARLVNLSEELVAQATAITTLEEKLEFAKARQRELAHRTIPDAMDEAGVDHIGLPDIGVDIRIKPWFDGSLPKREDQVRRQAAMEWLVEEGHGDLIKTTVSVVFGRGEHNQALTMVNQMNEFMGSEGWGNVATMNEDVHHMTYKAFLREQVEAGVALPLDTLNATVGRVAKIEQRRK
jgi:hypothetical protein